MTETTIITAERFAALLEAYGADIARWPQDERLAAHAYAQTAPQAAALLAAAREIDVLLAAVPAPRPRPGLEAAILAGVANGAARKTGWTEGLAGLLEAIWPSAAVWKPASVFVSALVLGAVIGGGTVLGTPSAADPGTSQEDVLAYAVPTLVQDLN